MVENASSPAATAHAAPSSSSVPRIVVLGGGSVGLYAAKRLRKRLGSRAHIIVVDANPYMTYLPFLPETAAGAIEGRDVVAPFLRALKGVEVQLAKVTAIKTADKTVELQPQVGEPYSLAYDELIVSVGSVSRTLPIPGLAEVGMGFKSVEEALALRDKVLQNILLAADTTDPILRSRLMTFAFVGGGFAGIEAVAEVEDMARSAVAKLPTLKQSDLRFVVIEGADRILPELPLELANYGLANLQSRGVEVLLKNFLSSCVDGHVVTSTGVEFDADTLVWCAGVKPSPVLDSSDLPRDRIGRVTVLPTLQVIDAEGTLVPHVWSAGDCAAVPDVLNEGKFMPPNAQNAVREAVVLADNLAATLTGGAVKNYQHKNLGTVASLGLHKGVAFLFNKIPLKGWIAWAAHRAYHVKAMPTASRKYRILSGWFAAAVARRELVPLSATADPGAGWRAVAVRPKPKEEDKPLEQKAEVSAKA